MLLAVRGPSAPPELSRAEADGDRATSPSQGVDLPPGPLDTPLTDTPAAVPPLAAGATPAVVPDRPALTVINNSRLPDLARTAAARYRAAGWPVAEVRSMGGRIAATTVYYPPGGQDAARSLADQFGIARVLPRFAGLPGQGLTVVVTRDLAGG